MPGAISTHSDAWNGTGRKPRAVLPMNVACCGWSASRKQYVRRTVPIGAGQANTVVQRISMRPPRFVPCVAPGSHAARRSHACHDARASMHRLAGLVIVLAASTAHADLLPRILMQPADPPAGGGQPAQPQPPPATPTVDGLTTWAGPARSTTLPELLQLAVRQSPALLSARIDIAIAEARIQQTWARDDWSIRAQG